MRSRRRLESTARLALAVLCAGFFLAGAHADDFPSRPITIIVPYSAGGVVDAIARTLGQQVTESTGQPVVVMDRAGANAIIGMQACARAPADGYTICLTIGDSIVYNPLLYANLPYDPVNDFAPVTLLGWSNSMLVAGPKAPIGSWKELVAASRAKPNSLNFGTWGPASTPDIYLQWIKHATGLEMQAVPYKGAGQANPALLAGEIDLTLYGVGNAMPHIKAGTLKPLVILGNKRTPLLPDLPTLAEEGADPGLAIYFCIFAPAKTPKPIVDKLNAEFVKALRTPRGKAMVEQFNLGAEGNSPEEFGRFLEQDRASARRVFTALGIRPSAAPTQ
jgi:tripartite-type tricarboxylate transporter receptor subunit TctC